jgi:hypothetical protein
VRAVGLLGQILPGRARRNGVRAPGPTQGHSRMAGRTTMRWRNAGTGIVWLLVIAGALSVWYRATYHTWPGMMPTVVHWCGRDYEAGDQTWTWAQITRYEAPGKLRAVGPYPFPFPGARTLLAAPVAGPVQPGEPCAMAVYIRTGPGRYRPYGLEGGP